MTASDGFADFLLDQLAPLGPVRVRRMFGSTGVFCGAAMFGLVHHDTFYVRVDDGNRELCAEAADAPFTYLKQGQPAALPFWRVPEHLLDDADALLEWAQAALAAGDRAVARRRPKPARRRAVPDTDD